MSLSAKQISARNVQIFFDIAYGVDIGHIIPEVEDEVGEAKEGKGCRHVCEGGTLGERSKAFREAPGLLLRQVAQEARQEPGEADSDEEDKDDKDSDLSMTYFSD